MVDRSTLFLALALVLFVGIYFHAYPSYFTSGDEHEYAKNAVLLTHGSLFTSENTQYCGGHLTESGKYVSNYPIGKSILLLPFLSFGLSGLFLSNLLLHVLNFFLFILILRKLKVNPLLAILFLFFPAFQWEARTLFPELGVLTLGLLAYYFWLAAERGKTFLSGFLLGIALLVRVDAFIGIIAFGAQAFLSERKRFFPFVAGAALGIAVFLGANLLLYGSPFGVILRGGALTAQTLFGRTGGWTLLVEFLTFIALVFIVLPFSLLSLFKKTNPHRVLFFTLTLVSLLFMVRIFSFWSLDISIPHTFTVRLRYFIPLLGLLMIPTFQMYEEWYHSRKEKQWFSFLPKIPALVFIIVLLLVAGGASVVLHTTHQKLIDSRANIHEKIETLLPENAIIIGSADDCIYFLPPFSKNKYYYKVSELPSNYVLEANTYVLEIAYETQLNDDTIRGAVTASERKILDDFIQKNKSRLVKISDAAPGVPLTIWKVI